MAYLVGDEYRRIPLTPVPDGVPVVWPDAIIHFQFATAPTLPAPPAMQQFPGAATYPEGLRARPIGTKLLHYDWQLTDVALVDVTNGEPGTLVPGTMSATWLSGKTGDAGGQAQPAELVLNTPDRNFWLARRGGVDAGIGPSPLQAQAAPVSGWTLGVMAHALVGAFHLPPEIVNADPLASEVSGQAAVRFPACRVRSMLRSHTASGRT